jgi:hypothetical protein
VSRRTIWFVVGGLAVALVLAFGVSRYASSEPDGLEKVAADQALDSGEQPHALGEGPFADYSTKGVDDPGLATGVAGVVGVFATFAIAGGLVWVASRASRRATNKGATTTT